MTLKSKYSNKVTPSIQSYCDGLFVSGTRKSFCTSHHVWQTSTVALKMAKRYGHSVLQCTTV